MSFEDIRLKGFSKNIKIQQAIDLAIDKFNFFLTESISLKENSVHNMILRENIYAKRSVPPFDRSAVDGFALKAEDTFSASETNPLVLKIIGTINIGENSDLVVEKGLAVQIPTGGIIPMGADAVIMLEDTNRIQNDYIEVISVVHPGKNISKKGEDIQEQQIMFQEGRKLRSGDRGFLLSAGILNVNITHPPSVAIIVTGDELVEPWEPINLGKIPEINSINLYDLCVDEGWIPNCFRIIKDDEEELKKTINKAIDNYDIILINGGTSVGKKDLVPVILNELGEIVFHGVAMRPGSPVLCAKVRNKILFGIPGFPTATIISFRFIIKPIISALMGEKSKKLILTISAKISRNVASKIGRMDFLRIKLEKSSDGSYIAIPIQIGGSGKLKNIIEADGIIQIAEMSEGLKEGDQVDVILW